MPLVVIKDPLFWMSSMCRSAYDVQSMRDDAIWKERCPALVWDDAGNEPVKIRGQLAPFASEFFEYYSLAELGTPFIQIM